MLFFFSLFVSDSIKTGKSKFDEWLSLSLSLFLYLIHIKIQLEGLFTKFILNPCRRLRLRWNHSRLLHQISNSQPSQLLHIAEHNLYRQMIGLAKKNSNLTSNFFLVIVRFIEIECSGFAVQRIDRVRIGEQLWQKWFEYIRKIYANRQNKTKAVSIDGVFADRYRHTIHRRPSLIDNIKTDSSRPMTIRYLSCSLLNKLDLHLIDIWMKDSIHKA